jgi:hypothetical protein
MTMDLSGTQSKIEAPVAPRRRSRCFLTADEQSARQARRTSDPMVGESQRDVKHHPSGEQKMPDIDPESAARRLAESLRSKILNAAIQAYEDAGVQGLCAEGRWEAAIAAIRQLDLGELSLPDPRTAPEIHAGRRRKMSRTNERTHPNRAAFPAGVPGPALRALDSAGIRSLDDLARWTERDLAGLHGMGPKAIGILRDALRASGRDFALG